MLIIHSITVVSYPGYAVLLSFSVTFKEAMIYIGLRQTNNFYLYVMLIPI